MVEASIKRLAYLTEVVPGILGSVLEDEWSYKPSPERWSKKQIIGHLIDSATNNHQRFIRGQFEHLPEISYDQNNWNTYGCYQEIKTDQLIGFWSIYNKQLLELFKRISPDKLLRMVKVKENTNTLSRLIEDYVVHLEHHLKQIIGEQSYFGLMKQVDN